LFSLFNGASGELTINLDKDLVNKISQLTGFDQTAPGQIAHLAYRMFKKFEIEVNTDDVTTLPQNLQDAVNGGDHIKVLLAPALMGLKMFSTQLTTLFASLQPIYGIQGTIETYFPITDVGALRLTNYSLDFWSALNSFLQLAQTF